MGRISRQVMFMEMARAASRRSTCFRLNVGAIIVKNNRPISVGWNGAEAGAPHCAGNECAGIVPGACGTIHAEVNAIKAARPLMELGKDGSVDLYCTHSPCAECVEFMVNSPQVHVTRLFFETPYRNTDHLIKRLRRMSEVYEVTPAGYIVDYFSRQVVELP